MINTILLCGALFFILVLIVGVILVFRFLSYRETLKLAEQGLARPERQSDGKNPLRWGIGLAFVGLALCIGLYPLGRGYFGSGGYPLNFGPWMLLGLLPLFFGLALVLIYYVTRK